MSSTPPERPSRQPGRRGLRQAAARGFFWSAVETAGGQLFAFAVFLILARLLTPADFGLVALAMVYIRVVQEPFDEGLADAVIQRRELEPAHVDSAFWLSLGAALAIAVATAFLAGPVAGLLGEPRLAPIILALSVSFPLVGLRSVQQALLRRHLRFRLLAMRTLSATIVGGMVGVAMAWAGFGVWSLVAQRIVTGVVAVAVLWKVSDWRPGLRISFAHLADLAAFSLTRGGTRVLQFGARRIPDLLIGYLLGPVALGYFAVGQRLVQSVNRLLTLAISKVALPSFARLQAEPERILRAFYLVTRMSSLVGFPAFLGLAVLGPRLVPVVFGPQWAASVPVMQLLAILGFTQCVGHFNTTVMAALGKPQWQLALSVLNIVLTVILMPLAAPYGIAAVTLAYLSKSLVLSPLTARAARRLIAYDLLTYLRQFVPSFTGTIVMALAVVALGSALDRRLPEAAILGLQVGAGLLAYVAALGVLAPELLTTAARLAREGLPATGRRLRSS
jgi:PST family polysaccharide transporter